MKSIPAIFVGLIWLITHGSVARAAVETNPLAQAQEYYNQSKFDQALRVLDDLADDPKLSHDDRRAARELQARAHIKTGEEQDAIDIFVSLLRDRPHWRPDGNLIPPDEMAVFAQALEEFGRALPLSVTQAEELYTQSRFREAIVLLQEQLNGPRMEESDEVHVRALLARSYVKAGDTDMAIKTFEAILDRRPHWRPDPIRVPPDERAVFAKALERAGRPSPTYALIGAGASLAIGIVALAQNAEGNAKHEEAMEAAENGDDDLDSLNDEADSHYKKATAFGITAAVVGLVDAYLWARFAKKGGDFGPIGGSSGGSLEWRLGDVLHFPGPTTLSLHFRF
jgi:tetratricopeptide (TPR) repeat protein